MYTEKSKKKQSFSVSVALGIDPVTESSPTNYSGPGYSSSFSFTFSLFQSFPIPELLAFPDGKETSEAPGIALSALYTRPELAISRHKRPTVYVERSHARRAQTSGRRKPVPNTRNVRTTAVWSVETAPQLVGVAEMTGKKKTT